MLNIIVPMAGRGSRFAQAGYTDPKPFIDVKGKRMIERVIDNLTPDRPHRFIFIAQREHLEEYSGYEILKKATNDNCVIIPIDEVTEGAACTVLLAKDYINNSNPLMMANSDQFIDYNINAYLEVVDELSETYEGVIMTMERTESKWSFVVRNRFNKVIKVVEKQPVSSEATVGVYNWNQGSEFVRAAEMMIALNIRHRGEFYVAPTFNQLIKDGGYVECIDIGKDNMHGLGTPEDLELFLKKNS